VVILPNSTSETPVYLYAQQSLGNRHYYMKIHSIASHRHKRTPFKSMDERVERTIQSLEEQAALLKQLVGQGGGPEGGSQQNSDPRQIAAMKQENEQLRRDLNATKLENEKLGVRIAILCRALDERDKPQN
jgi:cell division protein FtsB